MVADHADLLKNTRKAIERAHAKKIPVIYIVVTFTARISRSKPEQQILLNDKRNVRPLLQIPKQQQCAS